MAIRKILKSGDSYAVTIPIEMIDKLKWREKRPGRFASKLKGFLKSISSQRKFGFRPTNAPELNFRSNVL